MDTTLKFTPELTGGRSAWKAQAAWYSSSLTAYTRDYPILLTDDEPHILSLYEHILDRQELHYISTREGLEALHICRTRPISLIISDLQKPYINGLEILRELRADSLTGHLPFMLVTATPSYAVQDHLKQLGGDGYLIKPFPVIHFVEMAQRLVRLHGERLMERALVS